MERLLVILNPFARRGRGARLQPHIHRALKDAGLSYDLVLTEGIGHAIVLARQAKMEGYQIVAAAGGDGTVSEAVNGLAQVTPPNEPVGTLAIFPIGNGNDFATMAGCPRSIDAVARAIAAGRTRRVDLGRLVLRSGDTERESFFDNNVGIGFEGRVNAESHKIKRVRGMLLYLVAIFRALRDYRPAPLEVRWESVQGEWHSVSKEALMIAIGNSRRTGGGFYPTPYAALDDGLLDVAIADALPLRRILALLPKVLRGTHLGDPAVHIFRCSRLSISSSVPLPVHADGELLTMGAEQLDVEVLPGRLEVIV